MSTGTATKLKINFINQVYKQTERFIELGMFAKKVYQTFCVLLAFENLVLLLNLQNSAKI